VSAGGGPALAACRLPTPLTPLSAAAARSIPLIRPVPGRFQLEVAQEGLQLLKSLTGPVAPVIVIGPYRSGKSFLLNQLLSVPCGEHLAPTARPHHCALLLACCWAAAAAPLAGRGPLPAGGRPAEPRAAAAAAGAGADKGFGVGHTRDTQTKGIWLWGRPQAKQVPGEGQQTETLSVSGCRGRRQDAAPPRLARTRRRGAPTRGLPSSRRQALGPGAAAAARARVPRGRPSSPAAQQPSSPAAQQPSSPAQPPRPAPRRQVLYVDTEGFESTGRSNAYDDRIFALSTVLSSVLVYNLPETIRESDVAKLSFAVDLAQGFYDRFGVRCAAGVWAERRAMLRARRWRRWRPPGPAPSCWRAEPRAQRSGGCSRGEPAAGSDPGGGGADAAPLTAAAAGQPGPAHRAQQHGVAAAARLPAGQERAAAGGPGAGAGARCWAWRARAAAQLGLGWARLAWAGLAWAWPGPGLAVRWPGLAWPGGARYLGSAGTGLHAGAWPAWLSSG
jgi:hypothetical protein